MTCVISLSLWAVQAGIAKKAGHQSIRQRPGCDLLGHQVQPLLLEELLHAIPLTNLYSFIVNVV